MYDLDEVRRLVREVIAASEPDEKDVLVDQAGAVVAATGPVSMITLVVSAAKASRYPDGVLPFRTEVVIGGQSVGELMLWVSAGMPDTLEYAWWTDAPPAGLPTAARCT